QPQPGGEQAAGRPRVLVQLRLLLPCLGPGPALHRARVAHPDTDPRPARAARPAGQTAQDLPRPAQPGRRRRTGRPVHPPPIPALGLGPLAGLGVLAVLFPPGVGPTPVEGIEVTKPPWIYWWMFTLENWIGLSGILWGGGVLFALLVAVPFLDRNPRRYWRQR